MDGSISHVVSHDSDTVVTVVHKKIHGKVFYEKDAIVTKSSTKESVEHRVTSSVSDAAAAISLATSSPFLRLTSESSLVNFTFSSSTERHSIGFKLTNGDGGFTGHVLDSVLVTKEISTFNGVIKVPSPVVSMDVTKCSIDTSLGSDSVRSCREQLGHASGLESSFCKTESSSQSSSSSSDDNSVISVVDDSVITDARFICH